jgi:hypothetical protein
MKSFDSDGNMRYILEEIKKTDTFYGLFKTEFSESIYNIIKQTYPDTLMVNEIDNLLQAYSVAILNATESVIDKDQSYPLYRLEEELGTMKRITLKIAQAEENSAFKETVHLKAKELMVKHFSGIYDLSSMGFRLLEQNAKLYNWEFVSNFEIISRAR